MHILPGDPFQSEQALPPEIHHALRIHYGLEDPWYRQYVRYLQSIVTWDLGPSFYYKNRTVNSILADGFPVSAFLGVEALLLAISMGITLGIGSAFYAGGKGDRLLLLISSLGVSVPSFVIASLLQYIFSLYLGLLPIGRWGTWSHTWLPAISLAILPAIFIARLTRIGMIEVLKSSYIKAARARGISEIRLCCSHALRNALLPVVAYAGPLSANILVGSFVVEKIFALPGLGQWFINSITNRDYPVIMGLTVFYSLILLTFVMLVDVICKILDPRIRRI
jgi:oligopeptide transport system permease protein